MNLNDIRIQLKNVSQEIEFEDFDGASSYANELADLAFELRENYEFLREITGK